MAADRGSAVVQAETPISNIRAIAQPTRRREPATRTSLQDPSIRCAPFNLGLPQALDQREQAPEHDLTSLDEHRPPLHHGSAVRTEAISAVEPRCPSQIGDSRSRNACHAPLRLGGIDQDQPRLCSRHTMAVTAINASRSSDVTRTLDTVEVGKAEVEKNDAGFGFGDVDEGGCAGATPGGGGSRGLGGRGEGGVLWWVRLRRSALPEMGLGRSGSCGRAYGCGGVSCHCATWAWSSHCRASGR